MNTAHALLGKNWNLKFYITSHYYKENAKSLVNLGKNIFFTEVYFDKNTKTVYI